MTGRIDAPTAGRHRLRRRPPARRQARRVPDRNGLRPRRRRRQSGRGAQDICRQGPPRRPSGDRALVRHSAARAVGALGARRGEEACGDLLAGTIDADPAARARRFRMSSPAARTASACASCASGGARVASRLRRRHRRPVGQSLRPHLADDRAACGRRSRRCRSADTRRWRVRRRDRVHDRCLRGRCSRAAPPGRDRRARSAPRAGTSTGRRG